MPLKIVLCSDCFKDYGIRRMAERMGHRDSSACPVCGSRRGKKLNKEELVRLCDDYFVTGSFFSSGYGASPRLMTSAWADIQDNISNGYLDDDLRLINEKTGQSVFYYGPPMWRVGITEWMERLQSKNYRVRDKVFRKLSQDVERKDLVSVVTSLG